MISNAVAKEGHIANYMACISKCKPDLKSSFVQLYS